MKIMAVDYGDARTGLAVCDRTETLSSPVGVIEEKSMAKVAQQIIHASREFEVKLVVLGLPRNMDGSEGARAQKTRKLGGILENLLEVPLAYWDERGTTKSAEGLLGDAGAYGKKRKALVDAVAATVILDSYLAHRRGQAAGSP
ncbi:Holliday junction resolvase RuvX [Ruminococcaceae bacterium OttesenSCG-928-I18]|nr:Holliday junction resolvase RuvX [Ruminococcaceae bacterium OttesenSCG-928-I18]